MGQPFGVIICKNPWWPTLNFWYIVSDTKGVFSENFKKTNSDVNRIFTPIWGLRRGRNRVKNERKIRKLSVKKLFYIPGCPYSFIKLLFTYNNISDNQKVANVTPYSTFSPEIAPKVGKTRQNKMEENLFLMYYGNIILKWKVFKSWTHWCTLC